MKLIDFTSGCQLSKNEHVVIIGNGISGITCARNIRKKSRSKITVISSETSYHYSRTALMYIYMGHLRFEDTKPYEDSFWKKNNITLLQKHVIHVNPQNKTLIFNSGESIGYDVLIIATGSKPNMFGWPGQHLIGVQGLYSYQDLLAMESNTKTCKDAVVVGGGLIGVEMAEMLVSRNIKVHFVVRELNFWSSVLPKEESELIENHIIKHGVNLLLDTELKEILGDEAGKVKGVTTSKGQKINAQFVAITVGVSPNISFLKNSGIETDRGVLINEYFETNVQDIYAIGDCAQFKVTIPGRKSIEQVWYTGRMHGETLAYSLTSQKASYSPGIWYNSAKFFDIEYQTYGYVPPKLSEELETFFWKHTDGEKCFRVVFNSENRAIVGVNVFGIRMRHEVFDVWIREKKSVDFVLHNIKQAFFDPEFFVQYDYEIIQCFNRHLNTSVYE